MSRFVRERGADLDVFARRGLCTALGKTAPPDDDHGWEESTDRMFHAFLADRRER